MNNLVSCEERLKSMIVTNKQECPKNITKLLKSEIIFVLKNYFDVTADDVVMNISVNEFARFNIYIEAEARNIKIAHIFN